MLDILFAFWLVFFVIFAVINIRGNSVTFGCIAGIWILLMGLFIIMGGIQIESGAEIVEVSGTVTSITWTYDDATLAYSTYSFVWGMVFILIGVYMLYANLLKKKSG